MVEVRLAASRAAARISISIAVRGSPGLKEIQVDGRRHDDARPGQVVRPPVRKR